AVALWTQEAGAFTTAKRLCVSNARRTLKNSLNTAKVQAQNSYQANLRACFNDPGTGCVSQCFTTQSASQVGDPGHGKPGPQTKRDTCSNSQVANDGITSCLEQFDADQAVCCLKTADPSTQGCSIVATGNFNTDAADQLACDEAARLKRFTCQQGCAAKTQADLDKCTQQFNDCLEGCG